MGLTPPLRLVGGKSPAPAKTPPLQALADPAELSRRAQQYALSAKADNTKRAYLSDWRHFETWCAGRGEASLPATPETVELYLVAHAQVYKISTLTRRIVAISLMHRAGGYADPPTAHSRVREVWRGIRRERGVAPVGKAPLLSDDIKAMLSALPATPGGTRDRALLLLGFGGAFRRSELVALDVSDVAVTREGLVITLRRSKTDQEGRGRRVGIPTGAGEATCPVRAYQAWLSASGIKRGAIFRGVDRLGRVLDYRLTGHAVSKIVKRSAERVGLDPGLYGGHSLRAGLATSAAQAGVPRHKIRAQTGHKSDAMLDRYIRDSALFTDNAAGGVGL